MQPIWATGAWRDGPYRAIYQRLVDEGGWEVRELESGHDVMQDNPVAAERLIRAIADGSGAIA